SLEGICGSGVGEKPVDGESGFGVLIPGGSDGVAVPDASTGVTSLGGGATVALPPAGGRGKTVVTPAELLFPPPNDAPEPTGPSAVHTLPLTGGGGGTVEAPAPVGPPAMALALPPPGRGGGGGAITPGLPLTPPKVAPEALAPEELGAAPAGFGAAVQT